MLKNKIISKKRNFKISPYYVGKTIKVHNGLNYDEILIRKEMVNHKLGEFSFTRKPFSFKKKKKK